MSDIDGLPIIEVMEYPQVDGITPTVIIPEVSEDAISREWILSQGKYYYNGKGEQEYAIPIGTIKSAPSVIPQPKEGEWIPCSKEGYPLTELGRREGQKWYGYKCSKCNFIYKGNALTESPFCQNCGAKMKGAEDEV